MLHVIAAGTPITAGAYHGAVVGARDALAEADRVNAAHWKAANEGKYGYRRPDVMPATTTPMLTPSKPAVPHQPQLIPDDLTIPAFLLRRPLPRVAQLDRLAA